MTILVGENINIMSRHFGVALRERQAEPIENLARNLTASGIDYLDLNIGPARKSGAELMQWLVSAIQKITNLPLSLDTTNTEAIEAGLKLCQQQTLINSVSLQPERMERLLPIAKEYNAEIIGLLWGPEGMPRDLNERCMLAVDLVYKANQAGIPNEDIWIDPIVTPISGDINQLNSCLEFLEMLPEIAPGCKSIVGLSNVSNGAPSELRAILNRTYFMMLSRYGLYAAIVDAFDHELIDIARGKRPDLIALVHRAMDDGDETNFGYLNKQDQDYVKTVKVLTGKSLYSDSWLMI